MDMLKFHDVRIEKANAISRYRRLERIATLFRFVELCFFLIIVSKFSNQFPFSLKSSGEYFRGILISPRFVFVVGNVIILVLFLKSGEFSTKNGEKPADDLYEEYVEKCRRNQDTCVAEEKMAASQHGRKYGVCSDERKIHRSCSDQNLVKATAHGHQLRRSMTEQCRNYSGSSSKAEDNMSGEEFRRTVEAFIARQQRSLREEEST
ncbi:uncharacterized protein [Henckelia pumila]|uniref:uncharacterized protein n=1 Tax=Henckelia pumila TaxID=405737 RepID=UPI003C6DEDC2